jgi:hypothetical protein
VDQIRMNGEESVWKEERRAGKWQKKQMSLWD